MKYSNTSYEVLKNNPEFATAFHKVNTYLSKKTNLSGKGSFMEDRYGFNIDSSFIQEAKKEGYVSYTMYIKRETPTKHYFENLVIETKNKETTKAYVVQYFPKTPIKPTQHDSFIFEYDFNFIPIQYEEGRESILYTCGDFTQTFCDWGDDTHIAGPDCTAAYVWEVTYELGPCDGGDIIYSGPSPSFPNNPSSGDYPGYNPNNNSNGGGGVPNPNAEDNNTYSNPIPCYKINVDCPEIELMETDPCDEIAEQIANTDFQEKEDIVNSSSAFSSDEETGFSQNQNGDFTQLPAIDDGHSLGMPSPLPIDIIGFLHCHINSYYGVDTNGDGVEDFVKVIKMPSSGDIVTFLNILVNANANNIPLIDIYGSMYSSAGDYTLKFTGDINDVLTNINNLRFLRDGKILEKKYKQYFQRYGKQKAFLRFLKNEIGIDGVRLFKIKNSGTIKEKFLNNNENVESENC